MSKAKPSQHEINQIFGTRQKREEMSDETSNKIKTALKDIIAKSKKLPKNRFNAWDIASIQKAIELNVEAEMEDLRRQIARLMDMAGTQYGVEENGFWKRFHARQKVKRDE